MICLFIFQQIKSAERYLKRLEFHLAKVTIMLQTLFCYTA